MDSRARLGSDGKSAVLHERARRMRRRLALHAWEYRQRDHSHGVWSHLGRVLAEAEPEWISAKDAPAPRRGLACRARRHGARTAVSVRLGAEALAARRIVLLRFP